MLAKLLSVSILFGPLAMGGPCDWTPYKDLPSDRPIMVTVQMSERDNADALRALFAWGLNNGRTFQVNNWSKGTPSGVDLTIRYAEAWDDPCVPLHANTSDGVIRLNRNILWSDVYSVMIHEIGHAFGLPHSDNRKQRSVMFPILATYVTADRGSFFPDSQLPRVIISERLAINVWRLWGTGLAPEGAAGFPHWTLLTDKESL